MHVFRLCSSLNITYSISSYLLKISLSLLGDCSSYPWLSGATKGAWGHHFCPPWRPQLPGRSPSDGRSWCVLQSYFTLIYTSAYKKHVLGAFISACTCWFWYAILNLVLPALLRQDHWDPHPCLWHRNSHDCYCWHGTGPPANPQPASCRCPHCQLSPQLQRQHIGMTHTDSTETNRLSWCCVSSLCSEFASSTPPIVWRSSVEEWAGDWHATASVSVITVLSF